MFLTRATVERFTGKRRFSAMRRVLDAHGITYVTAATGEPLVASLDGKPAKSRNNGPRWDRIGA